MRLLGPNAERPDRSWLSTESCTTRSYVERAWGIRLGKGTISIEVWDSYVASARGRTMSEQVVRSYMVPRA